MSSESNVCVFSQVVYIIEEMGLIVWYIVYTYNNNIRSLIIKIMLLLGLRK